jgi:hypothetical protein
MVNYLTNACKQTQSGSIRLRIYVRIGPVSETNEAEMGALPGSLMTPKTDVLVVECEDTGPGIPLDKYPTLFTPLADVESNHTSHSKMHNSGLGLYSVATGECIYERTSNYIDFEYINHASSSSQKLEVSGVILAFSPEKTYVFQQIVLTTIQYLEVYSGLLSLLLFRRHINSMRDSMSKKSLKPTKKTRLKKILQLLTL